MSRRRNVSRDQQTGCTWAGCQWPTVDGAYVCEPCLDELAVALLELLPRRGADIPLPDEADGEARMADVVPGLWEDLEATIAGEQGVDYRTLGSSGPSEQTGIVLHERAAEIAVDLRRSLTHLVRDCQQYRIEHTAPDGWGPRSTRLVPGMAEWLRWRIDGIAWHPTAAASAEWVRSAVSDARWVVERPAARQQLGDCPAKGCDGWLSALPGQTYARCNREGHAVEAQPLRDAKVAELHDRLLTAAEIARLSTYLGLTGDREQVRKRINQWAHRGEIAEHPVAPTKADPTPDPRFRFGDVYARLLAHESKRHTTTDTPDSKGA